VTDRRADRDPGPDDRGDDDRQRPGAGEHPDLQPGPGEDRAFLATRGPDGRRRLTGAVRDGT
jgi:hypothetical protein